MKLGQVRDSTSRTCCCPPAEYAGSRACNKCGKVAIRGETTVPQSDRYRRWSAVRQQWESLAPHSADKELAWLRSANANQGRHLTRTRRDRRRSPPPGFESGSYP